MRIVSLINGALYSLLLSAAISVDLAAAESVRDAESRHSPSSVSAVAVLLAKLYPEHTLPSKLVQCEEPAASTLFSSDRVAFLLNVRGDTSLRIIKVELIDSLLPNALAIEADDAPATIRVSSALLEQLPDEAALAFILAHEMYHLRSGKVPTSLDGILLSPSQLGRIAETHQRWEAEADADAARVLQQAGYSIASARTMLTLLQGSDKSDAALFRSHPPIESRLQALALLGATTS